MLTFNSYSWYFANYNYSKIPAGFHKNLNKEEGNEEN